MKTLQKVQALGLLIEQVVQFRKLWTDKELEAAVSTKPTRELHNLLKDSDTGKLRVTLSPHKSLR